MTSVLIFYAIAVLVVLSLSWLDPAPRRATLRLRAAMLGPLILASPVLALLVLSYIVGLVLNPK